MLFSTLKDRDGFRQARIVSFVVDDLGPAGLVGEEMRRHAFARQRQRFPPRSAPREESLLDRRHPQVARRRPRGVVFEEPDAAGVTFALLDERFDEDAKESGDVRLADEQVERQLDGIALDAGHALGAAPLVDLARQGVGPCGSGRVAHQLVRDRGRSFREFTRAVERFTFLRLSSARLHALPPRTIIRHRKVREDGGTWPSRTSSESRRPGTCG